MNKNSVTFGKSRALSFIICLALMIAMLTLVFSLASCEKNNDDVNVDTNNDGNPDINIDTDDDGKADVNIDTDGDNVPDQNVDTDGDNVPDQNVDPTPDLDSGDGIQLPIIPLD